MAGVIGVGDRGAHDLAAVEIQDQVEKNIWSWNVLGFVW